MAGVVIAVGMACGGDGFVATPSGPSVPSRSMSAVIDGVPWHANLMVGPAGGAAIGTLSITGYWSSTDGPFNTQMQTLGLTVHASSVGTFTIADGSVISMSFTDGPYPPVQDPTVSAPGWFASSVTGTGSGTITITSYSQSRVIGTFSFVAPAKPATPATGTRTITNGVFDVSFE